MIISDWMMPEMDGITLCQKIRSSGKKAYAYIVKPFKPDELRSRIKTGERIITLERSLHQLQEDLVVQNRKLDETLRELKITQGNMLQSEKMASIGQLAAGVAHEINNPIGFIGSNLDALKDYMEDMNEILSLYQKLCNTLAGPAEKGLSAEIKDELRAVRQFEAEKDLDYLKKDIPELLHDCKEGTLRVGKIVADLKNFAHPGNDRKMLVDINKGLESTLNVVYNELKYKAEVIRAFGDVPMVEGFPQKLNQVFMNILVNVAQAIAEKGKIRVETRKEGGNVLVSFSDTGCGIKEEHFSKIFDPFFTTKEIGAGTGLGMNMAYHIVKEHRGEIFVNSVVGRGTTFTVSLPGKS